MLLQTAFGLAGETAVGLIALEALLVGMSKVHVIGDAINHFRANIAHRLGSIRFFELLAVLAPFTPEMCEKMVLQSKFVIAFLAANVTLELWLPVPDHVMVKKYSARERLEAFTAGQF